MGVIDMQLTAEALQTLSKRVEQSIQEFYVMLAGIADENGELVATRKQLAQRMRVEPTTISRWSALLKAAGFLAIEARYNDMGGRSQNLYRLLVK